MFFSIFYLQFTLLNPMQIDYDGVIDEMSDPKHLNIEQYFTPMEFKEISQYEKKRFQNLKRNYLVLMKLGNFVIIGILTSC